MPIPPKQSSTLANMIIAVAALAGVAWVGASVLDWHQHTCTACGATWSHLGAFNVGDQKTHTCTQCGSVQWRKDLPANAGGHHV